MEENATIINFNLKEFSFLKKNVYDFLYKNSESINDAKVYSLTHLSNSFIIVGKSHSEKLFLKNKRI
jgi:hypothetical protein